MKALLDTDILSELFRGKNGTVQQRAAEYRREHGPLTISVITEVEIARVPQGSTGARSHRRAKRRELAPAGAGPTLLLMSRSSA